MSRVIVVVFCAAMLLPLPLGAKVWLTGLTVEGRRNPVGIDDTAPRFGWQIVSDRRNVMQRSYRIIVASSEEGINNNVGDVWDSGTVASDSSQWVTSGVTSLKPNSRYFWKVEVTTNRGQSGWSEPAVWTTGLMSDDAWRGCWIGLDSLMPWGSAERHSRISSRYLRKRFEVRAAVVRATMHISGLGLYTLHINGVRVGDDVLTPVPTDYTRSVIYNTYDVTHHLEEGTNAVGVVLAGGHYFAQTQNFQTNVRTTYGYPKLIANLIIEYADGKADTVVTDTSWRLTADGAIRYANEYDGELYDATRMTDDWATPSFDDSRWMTAHEVDAPGGVMRGNVTPAMSVYAAERPVEVRKYGRRFIIDFGTNNAGRIRLGNIAAGCGDTVTIRHAELLAPGDSMLYVDNLRSAEATTRYVGDGKQRQWTPEFTYYGFRYAEITGMDSIDDCDVMRELIADRMDDADTGISIDAADGSTLLNDILANARRGIRSNYKGFPVDCPQRDERMPWLGDRTTGCLGESYVVNNHSLYAKWVADICQSQRRDGSISDVAPAYWRLYTGNVTWPAALPFACDMLYRQYGDLRPMSDCYDAIKRFLAFIRRKNDSSTLIASDRYGDWCVPPESPHLVHSKDPARKTDGRLLASSYYYYLCRMMQNYATLLGHNDDSRHFGHEAEAMAVALNDSLFADGRYSNGTVTANLLPMAMGIVPDSCRAALADSITATIRDNNDTHISCGVIGIQWLMRWLSDSGNGELAYQLATADSYPSWGYMVRRGATTIWELWNGDTAAPSMNSGNHVMLLGDLLPWCYERLAGIRTDGVKTGFRHVVLQPDFSIKALRGVTASHPSPYGVIRSCWHRRQDGKTEWTVCVPANTTAEVHLPGRKPKMIGSGTYRFIF